MDAPHTSALGQACDVINSRVTNIFSRREGCAVCTLQPSFVVSVFSTHLHTPAIRCMPMLVPLSIDPSLCLFHPHPPPIHLCELVYLSVHPSYASTCVVPFFTNRFLIVQINNLLPMRFSYGVNSTNYDSWYESKGYR